MGKKQAKTKKAASRDVATYVLFGLDESGKPRAARFTEHNEKLISRAAQSMGLRVGVASGAQHSEFLAKLPHGRLHAAGKNSVPNVSQVLYDQLNKLVGGDPGPVSTTLPKTWDELASGHLVIAQESVSGGWWEAVVIKREGDTLTLKWRDYPEQDVAVRPLTAIALLHHAKS